MTAALRYFFGTWKEAREPLTLDEVIDLLSEADRRKSALANYPTDKILEVFARMGKKWSDPSYEARRLMLEQLPEESGFSREMIELGMNELKNMFNPALIERKIETELRGLSRLGDWKYKPESGTRIAWQPLGSLLHVISGNVFLVGAGSLIEGLITGNVSIFKMSSDERLFLPALLRSLQECDMDGVLSRSVAAVDFPSSNTEIISEFKNRVDGIVVWGGEEAVKGYRTDLPARTRLILFGPKLSIAVVTEAGLRERDLPALADALAQEICIWDQNACTAPQVCFVQGEEFAIKLAEGLRAPLEEFTKKLPPGKPGIETAVEIRKLRTVFEIAEARKEGRLLESTMGVDWTVIVDRDQTIESSPLHRTLRIVPFNDFTEVVKAMEPFRGYIQTVGLCAGAGETSCLIAKLAECGAIRITDIGQMAGGEIDDPHDGSYDLPQYVNIVFHRSKSCDENYFPLDFAPRKEVMQVINARLRKLIRRARSSEYYGPVLKDISVETTEDLRNIPILTRDLLERNIPPAGSGLLTGAYWGGYLSRSGGSTGEPKFSIYDGPDWENMIENAVRLFRAMGVRKGDRLANCFMAGDLYGSFVSFDHINVRVGVTNFGFAGDVKPDIFLKTWKHFGINVTQGVPTIIIPLFRELKKLDPSFRMEKIMFAGSPMSPSDREWVKRELGAKYVSSVIGANDGGQIGFQCGELSGASHHSIDDFNYIEIVDEQGMPLPDGEPGRILITSLLKYAVPLIRYDIGDRGRILPSKCACGRSMRVFEFLGRSDDSFSIGLMNVNLRDFREALKELPVSEVQLVACCEGGKEYIILRLETECTEPDFSDRVYQACLKNVAKLKERIETGKLLKLAIELNMPGKLPRNPRTGKVKGTLDERH